MFICLFFSANILCLENTREKILRIFVEKDNAILKTIKELELIGPLDFPKEVKSYRNMVENYIENRRKVCRGEYSPLIITSEKNTSNEQLNFHKNKRLRFDCLNDLKKIEIEFIKSMYIAKRNYLNYLHQQRMIELETAKLELINNIEKK